VKKFLELLGFPTKNKRGHELGCSCAECVAARSSREPFEPGTVGHVLQEIFRRNDERSRIKMPGGKLLRAIESGKAAQIRKESGAGPDDKVLIGAFQEDVVIGVKLKRASEHEEAARIRETLGVGADDEVFVVRI
jgi:hypothetical protein